MDKPQILIALGSPSDVPKVLPELPLDERADFVLSVASAHRVPENVRNHMHGRVWDAVVAGAGMSNKLFHDYVTGVPWSTLVFGLPIYDKATGGLTSRLSSQELPPGVAGVCVGMHELETAARLASRLTGFAYSKVAVHDFGFDDKAKDKVVAVLKQLKVQYRDVSPYDHPELSPDLGADGELALALFEAPDRQWLERMRDLRRPVVASFYVSNESVEATDYDYLDAHYENLGDGIGCVSFNGAENLALFGARVVGRSNPEVQKLLGERFAAGTSKYDGFKDLIPLRSKEDIDRAVQLAKEAK